MTEHETGARRGLPGEGTGMSTPGELFEQLAVAVKALEHIAESAEHPSLTVRSTAYLGQVARNALEAIKGTE